MPRDNVSDARHSNFHGGPKCHNWADIRNTRAYLVTAGHPALPGVIFALITRALMKPINGNCLACAAPLLG
ncbi:hypothetical protein M434DRAFT_230006 [Hypoxylon sp. CO27-5]|nr:hypothetical protein M434DRAFT_230006 [Hypoxylon sp. CO27-5]